MSLTISRKRFRGITLVAPTSIITSNARLAEKKSTSRDINMKIEQKKIVLQYGQAGSPNGISSWGEVSEEDAGKFVALDEASGGYPYPVDVARAHVFKDVQAATEYSRGTFIVRELNITYEWNE